MFEKLFKILKPVKEQTESNTSYISEEEEEDVSLESLVPQLSKDDYIPKSESFEMGFTKSNLVNSDDEEDEDYNQNADDDNNYVEEELESTENDVLGDGLIYDGYAYYYDLLD